MKKSILFILLFMATISIVAQEIHKTAKAKDETKVDAAADSLKRWFVTGSGSLAFSQAAFSNWAAGGENSVGLDAFINLKANYRKGNHAWANTIDLGYGFQLLGKKKDLRTSKTNDKIELTTAYGYSITKNKKWFVTALANLRTQFSAGYNYPDDSTVISNFMAPGYLVVGPGITYAPFKGFYMYLSPASGRFTFVLNQALADQGAFGVDSSKQVRTELGPYFRADLNKDLGGNVNLASTLELFTDYFHDFGNIDVNWNLLVTFKVNKWLAASFQAQLIYDDDVTIKSSPDDAGGPRTQFKELLGIGLSYQFNK
jgi:hypothetical protein